MLQVFTAALLFTADTQAWLFGKSYLVVDSLVKNTAMLPRLVTLYFWSNYLFFYLNLGQVRSHLDVFKTIIWKEINKLHCWSWIFVIGLQSIRDCKAQLSFTPENVITSYQVFLLAHENFQVIKKHYCLYGMINFRRSIGDFAKAKWLLRIQTVGDPAASCERESCILSAWVGILVHALVTPKVSWSSVAGY